MESTIRQSRQEDAGSIAAIFARNFLDSCPKGTSKKIADEFVRSVGSVFHFANYICDPARVILVDELNSTIRGYVMTAAEDEFRVSIRHLYVEKQHRGCGIGSALISAALAAAQDRVVVLSVSMENPGALVFYQRNGFRIIGKQEFRLGSEKQQDYVMERK